MSTQDTIKLAFATYLREYVAATLCTQRHVEPLIAHYRQAIATLRNIFPLDLATCCPGCSCTGVVQQQREDSVVWVVRNMKADDDRELPIRHCFQCGLELLSDDECQRHIDADAVRCLCGHSAASHANAATECNVIDCCCHNFVLDYESALVNP